MSYINSIYWSKVSTSEIIPQSITLGDMDDTLTNVIHSALRFDTEDSEDTGTDISSVVSIAGYEVTVSNTFTSHETPMAGKYRIQVVSWSPTGDVKVEFNAFQEII